MNKLSKKSVNYRKSTYLTKTCRNCSMFKAGVCSLVAGPIDPKYVCDRWKAK